MDYFAASLKKHAEWKGKFETVPKMPLKTKEDLSLAYTPGVAQACLAIQEDVSKSYELTGRGNLCAVVTDGTAVLGLGDIGPEAAMPVMEGKCILFKAFGGVDALPICLKTKDVDEIVNAVYLMSGSFGGINLEDISAPRCFEIERKLKARCDIPIFHDDQHGTAVVVLAGLTNALKVVGKPIESVRAVINGAGAAGTAVAKLLLSAGVKDVIACDIAGILVAGDKRLDAARAELAEMTNKGRISGSLADAARGADVLIGVSAPGSFTEDMIRSMARDPIVFACANPTPEIDPALARAAGAAVVATGRSDYPNQVNNVLAFPGIFRGVFDVRARDINDDMKLAAARAIAGLISEDELGADCVIPSPFDERVAPAVAAAVAEAARRSGAAPASK